MINITELHADRTNYGIKRLASAIKYIVIHYTANDGDKAVNNAKYFQKANLKASAHYFVDDTSVYESVSPLYVAYSVGGKKYSSCSNTGGGKYYLKCTNLNSISIELCDTNKNGIYYPTPETIKNAVELTKELMKKYNVPAERVIRHFDVVGKMCPAYWCGDTTKNRLWKVDFWDKLEDVGRDYSPVFNAIYYATNYPDLRLAGLTTEKQLLKHFVEYGMKEARQASPQFSVYMYRARYGDLNSTFKDDWEKYYLHYLDYGLKEGRQGY